MDHSTPFRPRHHGPSLPWHIGTVRMTGVIERRICTSDGCGDPALARWLCKYHYYKAKREGVLDEVAPNPSTSCEHCGEPIPKGRRWGAQYCSTDCKQHATDLATKRHSVALKAARPRFCAWCKEELDVERETGARYCSRSCGDNWRNHNKAAMRRSSLLASREPCEVCGRPIPEGRAGHAIYCSVKCKRRSRLSGSPEVRARAFDENIKRTHGMTTADYEAMWASQGGRCLICGTDKPGGRGNRLHVDHCHETGRIRGLLCTGCNIGLGQFKDDPARLRAAADYLERHMVTSPSSRGG